MQARGALRRFWERDHALSVILALLVLLVFVLPPFTVAREERGPFVDVALTLLLAAGVAGLQVRPALRLVLLVAAVVAMATRVVPGAGEQAIAASSLVSLGLMAVVVLYQTFSSRDVSIHHIQGAVAAYLLLGLVWAAAYALVAAIHPGAFTSTVALSQDRSFVYYSFITLTTVGYGDVSPVHPTARSLAILEALTGQLYPAVLLARIVTLHTQKAGG
jgi:ion channel